MNLMGKVIDVDGSLYSEGENFLSGCWQKRQRVCRRGTCWSLVVGMREVCSLLTSPYIMRK